MSSTIDQQFVEYIVKSLVGNPDAVSIERRIDEKGVLLELTVDGEDLGRVIGKRGATAQSLRTLLRALGTKNEARYNLKIVDTGGPGGPHRDENRDDTAASPAPASDVVADEPASTQPVATADDDDDQEVAVASDATTDDVLSKTRAELAELDDLDV